MFMQIMMYFKKILIFLKLFFYTCFKILIFTLFIMLHFYQYLYFTHFLLKHLFIFFLILVMSSTQCNYKGHKKLIICKIIYVLTSKKMNALWKCLYCFIPYNLLQKKIPFIHSNTYFQILMISNFSLYLIIIKWVM